MIMDSLKETYNNILTDDVIKFIFKAALKKGNKRITLTKFLFSINGIQCSIDKLNENIYFKSFCKDSDYMTLIKESKNKITLELTSSGESLAEVLDYEKTIILNTFLIKSILTLIIMLVIGIGITILPFLLIIAIPVLLIAAFFNKNLRESILYIVAVLALIYGILAYYK